MSTQPSDLRSTMLTRSKIPGFTRDSPPIAVTLCHWSALNTLIFQVSPQPEIQRIKVRRKWRPVDWSSTPNSQPAEVLIQALLTAEKKRFCPIMHEPHVLSLMKRDSILYCLDSLLKSKNVFKRLVIHEETKLSKLSRNSVLDEDMFLDVDTFWIYAQKHRKLKPPTLMWIFFLWIRQG